MKKMFFYFVLFPIVSSKICGNAIVNMLPPTTIEERQWSLDNEVDKAFGDLIIPILILYDIHFRNRFDEGDVGQSIMQKFIKAIVKTAQYSFYSDEWLGVANITLKIIDVQEVSLDDVPDENGQVQRYHQQLVLWNEKTFKKNKQTSWEIVALLSGLNLWDHDEKAGELGATVTGLAHVGVLCKNPPNSAVIIEAKTLDSGYVLAHEIAHTLNVSHDASPETSNCPDFKYLMSSETSPGRSYFSFCSIRMARQYLSSIKQSTLEKCFKRDVITAEGYEIEELVPGATISADEQCQIAFGNAYRAVHDVKNICSRLRCRHEFWTIGMGFALVGTPCYLLHSSHQHYCDYDGQCSDVRHF